MVAPPPLQDMESPGSDFKPVRLPQSCALFFHSLPSCTRRVSVDGKISLAKFPPLVKFEYFIYVRLVFNYSELICY